MRVLGVDPGATGAIAFLQISGGLPVDLEVVDLPTCRVGKRTKLDEYAFAREIDARLKDGAEPFAAAVLEQGSVRPQNGRVGAATFWLGIGAVRGVLAAHFIPIEIVTPHAWKAAMRLSGAVGKDASRLRASAIFPSWAGQDYAVAVPRHGAAARALGVALVGFDAKVLRGRR